LHDIPLKLTAKGSHQASLAEQWQKSCNAVALEHAKTMGVTFRPRNEVYNALCVFVPTIVRKLVGESKKSPACYIEGFVAPTAENWQDYFLGTSEDLADAIVGMMNPQPRARLVNAQSFALANDSEPEAIAPARQLEPSAPASKIDNAVAFITGQATKFDTNAIDVKSSLVPALDDDIPF
jgi:hypothetical protein